MDVTISTDHSGQIRLTTASHSENNFGVPHVVVQLPALPNNTLRLSPADAAMLADALLRLATNAR
jgi:hypothetical protein